MDQIISCLKGNLKCCWALVNTGENFFPGPVSTILLSSKLWSYLSIRDSMRRAKLSYENSSLSIVRRINFFKWWESIRLNDCKDQCIQNVQPTVSLPIFQCVRKRNKDFHLYQAYASTFVDLVKSVGLLYKTRWWLFTKLIRHLKQNTNLYVTKMKIGMTVSNKMAIVWYVYIV